MEKQQRFHHSVTENGNIQVRIVTEYLKDGEIIDETYGDPMTPANVNNMEGWDDKSKDIVAAITESKVLTDFALERLASGYVASGHDTLEQYKTGIAELVDYDRVIDDLGRISVRRITRIFDEGKEVLKKYHRSWIMPGDDPSGNDVMSRAVAEKLHTPEVIAAYETKTAENV